VMTATPSRGFSTSSMRHSFAASGWAGRATAVKRAPLPAREKLAKHLPLPDWRQRTL
jgi:hypothetical protein